MLVYRRENVSLPEGKHEVMVDKHLDYLGYAHNFGNLQVLPTMEETPSMIFQAGVESSLRFSHLNGCCKNIELFEFICVQIWKFRIFSETLIFQHQQKLSNTFQILASGNQTPG